MTDTNRSVHVLVASGRRAIFPASRWRAVGREAFLDRETRERGLPAFVERCREPRNDFFDPDPETVEAKVVTLDLVDADMDRDPSSVFVLEARGRSAAFGGEFMATGRSAYADRAAAEGELEAFGLRCRDPALGFDHASPEDLRLHVVEIALVAPDGEAAAV